MYICMYVYMYICMCMQRVCGWGGFLVVVVLVQALLFHFINPRLHSVIEKVVDAVIKSVWPLSIALRLVVHDNIVDVIDVGIVLVLHVHHQRFLPKVCGNLFAFVAVLNKLPDEFVAFLLLGVR